MGGETSIHLTPNGDRVFLHTDRGELIRAQLTGLVTRRTAVRSSWHQRPRKGRGPLRLMRTGTFLRATTGS